MTLSISSRMTLLMSFLVLKDSVLRKSVKIFEGHYTKLGCFTATLFTHANEKASEASAKPSGVGMGFASKGRKKNFLFSYLGSHSYPVKSSVLR